MDIRDINFEVEKLESTEDVNSAQAATMTLHEDWLDIPLVLGGNVRKGLSSLFFSSHTQKGKLENKKKLNVQEAYEAHKKYRDQGESRKSDHQTDLIQMYQI